MADPEEGEADGGELLESLHEPVRRREHYAEGGRAARRGGMPGAGMARGGGEVPGASSGGRGTSEGAGVRGGGTRLGLRRFPPARALMIGDDGIILLAESLKYAKNLIYLDISLNEIGPAGFQALCEVLPDTNISNLICNKNFLVSYSNLLSMCIL